ncbi:MAG: glycosyltransferase, partial [Candidatus Poribacteria bacterium]|nr:glycosyltransferase [Candidatus Poribacteria bacterium]
IVNRELCLALIQSGQCELSLLPYELHQFGVEEDAERFPLIQERLNRPLDGNAEFHIRHQWPPNFDPPPEGYWIIMQPWEYGSMPAAWFPHFCDEIDEIWVPSNYVRDCYIHDGIAPDKIAVVPNAVDFNRFRPGLPPLGKVNQRTSKRFKFLFVGGTIWRKGLDILLDAYTRAFTHDDDVTLVIKDMGGDSFYKGQNTVDQIRQIQVDASTPEIVYMTEMLSDAELPQLYTACNCLVHPYRGEGFGMPIAEAMGCGLPVIIPRGGATDGFTSDETAYAIPAGRVNLRIDIPTVREAWVLEPNRDALIEQMRHVASQPDEAKAKGVRASEAIRSTLSWRKSAEIILDRLQLLRDKPIRRFEAKSEAFVTIPAQPPATEREAVSPSTVSIPQTAEQYNEEAKQRYEAGDVEEAERLFKRAIRADARSIEPYNNLAVLYWQKGEIGAALYKLTEALRIDPDHLDTVANYGQICRELGCDDDARQTFEAYLQRHPDADEIRGRLEEF